ncbi:hypothetical protein C9374_004559 [Naegleria lovaniensis]|uniref:N-acetylglucosamine-1-phosphotransferase subunits alpha/beta n=1 Tax=Naegleria lovaniensis TaxID=51637 RepID=A0AA88KJH1_NAELO|nr:uncharacterized protein C9374_004559 [Naegleria lovaniensis]KAG2383222.1 hypothetical protein C9374_004559 [Naegleria lovaniensis]
MLPTTTANSANISATSSKKYTCGCIPNRLTKPIQKSFYSFATSKWGVILLIIVTFITLNSILHLLQSLLDVSIMDKTTLVEDDVSQMGSYCHRMYKDNIMKVNAIPKLCYEPMDIVYTWVNGSDPIHKALLKEFTDKLKEESVKQEDVESFDSSATETKKTTKTTKSTTGTGGTSTTTTTTGKNPSEMTTHSRNTGSNHRKSNHENANSIRGRTKNYRLKGNNQKDKNVGTTPQTNHEEMPLMKGRRRRKLNQFNDDEEDDSSIDHVIDKTTMNDQKKKKKNSNTTTTTTRTNSKSTTRTNAKSTTTDSTTKRKKKNDLNTTTTPKNTLKTTTTSKSSLKTTTSLENTLNSATTASTTRPPSAIPSSSTHPHPTTPSSTTSLSASQNNNTQDNTVSGSNRFRDNDELKFSLRSLERFAPWVRNIYIVTNGQVPNWLNVKNPKIKIVKHSDIYRDASHLPVFSSPSIESHIHRIPGLSKKFIYLNDDVMFGNNVYPEDFYSHSTGQRVFLSWEVPPCASGCQESWLGDGYCDLSCNVTQCDFDGGDCIGNNVRMSYGSSSFGNSWNNWNTGSTGQLPNWMSSSKSNYHNYCAASCPDTWIGDRFCDRPCNVRECGFDAGDCDFKDLKRVLLHEHVNENLNAIYVRYNVSSIYLNLNPIFMNAQITNGNHDNEKLVRSSTISQKEKLLIFTFNYQLLKANITKYTSENVSELASSPNTPTSSISSSTPHTTSSISSSTRHQSSSRTTTTTSTSNTGTLYYEEIIQVTLEAERTLNSTTETSTPSTTTTHYTIENDKLTISKSFIVKLVNNETFEYIQNKFNKKTSNDLIGLTESEYSQIQNDIHYNSKVIIPTTMSIQSMLALKSSSSSGSGSSSSSSSSSISTTTTLPPRSTSPKSDLSTLNHPNTQPMSGGTTTTRSNTRSMSGSGGTMSDGTTTTTPSGTTTISNTQSTTTTQRDTTTSSSPANTVLHTELKNTDKTRMDTTRVQHDDTTTTPTTSTTSAGIRYYYSNYYYCWY